ncbi:MAG: SMI1/KNR4 family protein [Chloroflexi bacterium]|nr:SMI1/KNR4 family protein [Chloroflexota bacterium]
MPTFNWEDLLGQWSRDALRCPTIAKDLPPEVSNSGWLGYPPATDEEIAAAEARLGTRLPASYQAFLKVTNGWRRTGLFVPRFLSTYEIDWFRTHNQDMIDAWLRGARSQGGPFSVPDEQYFVYGHGQDPARIRCEYLPETLQLSEVWDTEVYLLNPQVMTRDEEWEAWFLAHWLLGAIRYRSFWEMMLGEHKRFLEAADCPEA